jgi:hypothetical protein
MVEWVAGWLEIRSGVAYRRIKGDEAGHQIYGVNYESLNKNAKLGGGGLLVGYSLVPPRIWKR